MKKTSILIISLIVTAMALSTCGNYDYYDYLDDYVDPYGTAENPLVVNLWTDHSADLVIYIDGERFGTITEALNQAPECGSASCLGYYSDKPGTRHTFRAESADGSVSWPAIEDKLSDNCTTFQFTLDDKGRAKTVKNR